MAGRRTSDTSSRMTAIGPGGEPIAIVGSACRFAGDVDSPSRLWDLLADPQDLAREIPPDRFNIKGFYHPNGEYNGTTDSPKAYFLGQNYKHFDASFFNISPKEAAAIDPQQRILLEVVYEALESAGYRMDTWKGKSVAVYAGVMTADYDTVSQRDDLNTSQYYATGNARSILSNRLSYFFDWKGPSMTIDTACSSSLVALDQAVTNLRAGRCDVACVTGANLILTPEQFVAESSLHMLSPEGHCRMWDKNANGYARGEGVAAIFVKTLRQALMDEDRIEAVIRDIGVNSDGQTTGITMPSPVAQSQLIQEVYLRAGLDAKNPSDRCQYFEAHGTGTPAGDPREAEAIQDAFFTPYKDANGEHPPYPAATSAADPSPQKNPRIPDPKDEKDPELLVGSIKTLIGHTEGAAGLAGVLKVIQLMLHDKVTKNLHLDELNPEVRDRAPNLKVPRTLHDWPEVPPGQPKRASVNSFGFGGTNSHVVVEQYLSKYHDELIQYDKKYDGPFDPIDREPMKGVDDDLCLPLFLSAIDKKSLARVAEAYRNHILPRQDVQRSPAQHDLNDLAWHLYNRRSRFDQRSFVSGRTRQELADGLDALIKEIKAPSSNSRGPLALVDRPRYVRGGKELEDQGKRVKPKILGVFTGQGAQWAKMGLHLMKTSKTFCQSIRDSDRVLQELVDGPPWTLEGEILKSEDVSRVGDAEIAQPLCTAIQIALVKLLTYMGVEFAAVVGHSSGEIAAAYTAGRISAEHAMAIAYYRGKFAHLAKNPTTQENGDMIVTAISGEEAYLLCEKEDYRGRLWVAAINHEQLVTLSGDATVIRTLGNELKENNRWYRELGTGVAYHSPHMTDPGKKNMEALNASDYRPLTYPRDPGLIRDLRKPIPWFSTVRGVNADKIASSDLKSRYWNENMLNTVKFLDGLQAAAQKGPYDCAIEVGPHFALKSIVDMVIRRSDATPLPYTSLLQRNLDDRVAFANFLGFMWVQFKAHQFLFATYVSDSSDPGLPRKPRLEGLPPYPWDHSHEFYRESRIARQYHQRRDAPHPLLGVRGRDDNKYQLRWRNVLMLHQIPWVKGHTFEGMHLVPAAGYCSMAYDAAMFVLAGRQASDTEGASASVIELHDLQFSGTITLEPGSPGVETLFSLTIDVDTHSLIEGSFTLTSCPADGSTEMKKNFSGVLRIILGEPSLEALPARPKEAPETTELDPEAFYTMMRATNLEYSKEFKGLKTLRKRTHFASGTVKQLHNEDTANLTISPGTLDSCLQTAFVTVASPGDQALWTSFLPQTITRMRFNVASCEGKNNDDMLTVDAHLTDAKVISRKAGASFTADIEIFGQKDRLQMQVEGLTVASFPKAEPEPDYELYLTTVFDIDPDEEIVLAAPVTEPERPKFSLVESCERVAAFYDTKTAALTTSRLKLPAPYSTSAQQVSDSIPANGWPAETEETLDAFVKHSRYFETLDTIRRLGQMQQSAGMIKNMLASFMVEAHHLAAFQTHVSRIVKQIAHKYPRMQVMAITDPELGLTQPILNGLDAAYLSYRVGAEAERYLDERVLTTPSRRKKVSLAKFEFDEEGGLENTPLYDMVVVSASLIKTERHKALKRIRSAMRPGGFLILLESSAVAHQSSNVTASPENWLELLPKCGFTDSIKNSVQSLFPGYSVTVRHAESASKRVYLDPFSSISGTEMLAENILIVGGRHSWTGSAEKSVATLLKPHCTGDIDIARSFSEIDKDSVRRYTGVIVLADFDGPALGDLNAEGMAAMKALMRSEMKILWITHNARTFNADGAASIGFIRTLIAEVPNLRIQVLDFTTADPVVNGGAIAKGFARLVLPHPGEDSPKDERPLWVYETEVYMRRLVPLVARCLPWKEANARNNAPRRLVFDELDSLDNVVGVSYVEKRDGSGGYEVEVDKTYDPLRAGDESVVIKVGYSTADAINLGGFGSSYISMGRHVEEDKVYVALSPANASYIKDPTLCTHQPALDKVNQSLFVALLSRYVSALATALGTAADESLVLVEPDPMFQSCLKDVLVNNNIHFTVLSTDAEHCAGNPNMTYVHPNASMREIKALYRLGINLGSGAKVRIIDMLPEGSEVSRILKLHLPKGWQYEPASSLLAQQNHLQGASKFPPEKWQEALGLTMAKLKSWDATAAKLDRVTIPDLTKRSDRLPPFYVIDWKAERAVQKQVSYMPQKNVLSPNKTYIMVGITRDFGQSLSYLFADFGARHIVLCSRKPPTQTNWQKELFSRGVKVEFYPMDVTDPHAVAKFAQSLEVRRKPVGGVINGAMVLEDKVFETMSVETLHRVMRPKTIGSRNLDIAFRGRDMEFFIMTSSFAAIGGHAGQSNYAAANMFMNALAVKRRAEGTCGSTLNIGVIYGLGFLHREKSALYEGLSREGYPPISERDIHHMFLEAIEAGKPNKPDQVYDIITGLSRYDAAAPQHKWQEDPRFSHFTRSEDNEKSAGSNDIGNELMERINSATTADEIYHLILAPYVKYLEKTLGHREGTVTEDSSFQQLGVDSLAASQYQNWFYKNLGREVVVMKILAARNIKTLVSMVANSIAETRPKKSKDGKLEGGGSDIKQKGKEVEAAAEQKAQPTSSQTAQPTFSRDGNEPKDHNSAYLDTGPEPSDEELYDEYDDPPLPSAPPRSGQSGPRTALSHSLRTVKSKDSLASSTASTHDGRGPP